MHGAGSWRSESLPANWPYLRAERLRMDGGLCVWPVAGGGRVRCGAPATEVDHVVAASAGGDDSLANLQSLCAPHHKVKSSGEGGSAWGAVRRRMASLRRRPERAHPGLKG
jgi:5-methylcytosine-specific restriction protein A